MEIFDISTIMQYLGEKKLQKFSFPFQSLEKLFLAFFNYTFHH